MLQRESGWSRWLLREPQPGGGPLLFVFPHPGCGAETYRRWPSAIGGWEICPIQLPDSSTDRCERTERYRVLSGELASRIEQYWERSVAVFGHRESALLAYATAVALSRADDQVSPWVFLSAQAAPRGLPRSTRRARTDSDLAEILCRVILEIGGNPLPSLVENQVRSYQADVLAAAGYQTRPPEPSLLRLITVSWSDDDEVTSAAMAGWSDLGLTTAHVIPGNQYDFLSAPDSLQAVLASVLCS
ncbi:thioesterase II family protein [Saccharopolyspora tripterygii]